jgi:hypothetical protein
LCTIRTGTERPSRIRNPYRSSSSLLRQPARTPSTRLRISLTVPAQIFVPAKSSPMSALFRVELPIRKHAVTAMSKSSALLQ